MFVMIPVTEISHTYNAGLYTDKCNNIQAY